MCQDYTTPPTRRARDAPLANITHHARTHPRHVLSFLVHQKKELFVKKIKILQYVFVHPAIPDVRPDVQTKTDENADGGSQGHVGRADMSHVGRGKLTRVCRSCPYVCVCVLACMGSSKPCSACLRAPRTFSRRSSPTLARTPTPRWRTSSGSAQTVCSAFTTARP